MRPFRRPVRFAVLLLAIAISGLLSPHAAYSIMTDKNVFRHHDNGCMKIALTFDDGPSPVYTPAILDYLASEDIRATFFVVGAQAQLSPELLRREEAEGHEIGNHTDSHPRLSRAPFDGVSCTDAAGDASAQREALRAEIEACAKTVYETTEIRTTLFRPPEGYCTETISAVCRDMDYRIILWNIDTRDWDRRTTDAKAVAAHILDNVCAGDIILFHDCVSRKDSITLDALKLVIPELKSRGYQFVTVSELIGTDSTAVSDKASETESA